MNDEVPSNIARALRTLDARAVRAAQTVDAGRVTEGVLRRLQAAPPLVEITWRVTAVRIAAVLILTLAGALSVLRFADRSRRLESARLPLATSVESLTTREMTDVLKAVDVAGNGALASSASMEDLTEQELQALLNSLGEGQGT